jgi:hypothetical protein
MYDLSAILEFLKDWPLVYFLLCLIIVEAITEIITKSMLFSPVRAFFFNRRHKKYIGKFFEFVHDLLDCGYCTSVWIGFAVSYFIFCVDSEDTVIDVIIFGFVFHRLSNILHYLIDILDLKRPRDL